MDEDRPLTVAQAADYLQVSRSTIYRLMASGSLPYHTLRGVGRRIERSDLEALLREEADDADTGTGTDRHGRAPARGR